MKQTKVTVDSDYDKAYTIKTSRHILWSEYTISSWYKLDKFSKLSFGLKFILFCVSFITFCGSYPAIINHCITNCSSVNCNNSCDYTIYIFIGIIILMLFKDFPTFIKSIKEIEVDEKTKLLKETADSCTLCKHKTTKLIDSIFWILYGSFLSYLERIILFPKVDYVEFDKNLYNQQFGLFFLSFVILCVILTLFAALCCRKKAICMINGYDSDKVDLCIILGISEKLIYTAAALLYTIYWTYMVFAMQTKFWDTLELKWDFTFNVRTMMDISIIASLFKHFINMFEKLIHTIVDMECCI
eukprot:26012_1